MLEIIEVTSAGDPTFAAFSSLPDRVYSDDPAWAPDSRENTDWAFAESASGRLPMRAFVVVLDDAPVARAAAFSLAGQIGWVGLFECVAGHEVAGKRVLDACESLLSGMGYATVQAPRSDPLTSGLQISGFDLPQTLFTTHHPAHYLDVFLSAGYRISTRMVAPIMTRDRAPKFTFELSDVVIRPVELDRLDHELASFHQLQGAVFSGRPGYAPRETADTLRLVQRLLPYLDEELIIVAESDGEVVGSLICLPDGWQSPDRNQIDRARILSIGVLPGWERRGVGMAMGSSLMTALLRKGFQSVEGVWVLENNEAPQELAQHFGATPGRRFALLEKHI
jgi:ribosomal protein S18 acetylase RimI-like enzyme